MRRVDSNATLRVVDLFAGVGGLSVGFLTAESGGVPLYDVRLLADVDREAAYTFKRNYPTIAYWVTDLSEASGNDVRRMARLDFDDDLDVLVGGPPCQGLSRLKKTSLDDPRNARILDFARLVAALRPKIFVLENVPTLVGTIGSRLLERFVAVLSVDYDVAAELTCASEYGVPQRRQRTLVMGFRRSAELGSPSLPKRAFPPLPSARALIPDEDEGGGEIERIQRAYITVEDAIGDLPPLQRGEGDEVSFYLSPPLSAYQAERRRSARLLFNHRARSHSDAFLNKIKIIEEGGRNQELGTEDRFSDTYFSQAYARLHRRGIAQTITTYFSNPGSGRFTHYRDLRAITVREAARFQSFDDTFRFFGPQDTQQRHVGNAVPPLLSRAIAFECARVLLGSERLGPPSGLKYGQG